MIFLKDISRHMKNAQSNMTAEKFMLVAGLLSETKDAAREEAQNITSTKIKDTVQKLKKRESLLPEDIHYLRLWIIGDAESYTGMEESFQEWLAEFARLEGILEECETKKLTLDDLFRVHGILEDALRIAADIGNYLEKKERIVKFETAIGDEKNLDREILINILETKMKSPRL